MIKVWVIFLAFFSSSVFAQNLAPDIANYDIAVNLDTKAKTLTASQVLTWTNTSPVSVNELQFHLYLNAFRDKKSTFMKESGGKLRNDSFKKSGYGNIYVTHLKSGRGEELLGGIKYIQPDDFNEDDRTVISVPLEKDLKAGETIMLEIGFKAKLPEVFARTGYGANDYYLIGQWFPKIGVFEQNNAGNWAWNCHQFHANSEFYADFGTYKVSITLPESLKVGATGQQVLTTRLKNGLKSVVFEANDVHDFAWTASPKFKVFEKKWKHVTLKAMMQPEHSSQYKRYFDAAEKSLAYFEKTLGAYPYSTLTMVDPPQESSGSGGMEYPTFMTCGSYWGVGKWLKMAEIVTVHEFGHQYFQGILASNEFEQSFLDEGFNQYMEGRIMDESYGSGAQLSLLGFKVGDMESSRYSYVTMDYPEMASINNPSWKYPKGVYGELTYTKTATVLKTFENLVGREKMDLVLKSYYEKWKFKHPKLSDFVETVNSVLNENYDWYFNQAFEKSYSCDYSVDTLRNDGNKSYFILEREGRFKYPVEVLIGFEDGSEEVFVWESDKSREQFDYGKRLDLVKIDPQKKNLMDLNLINNQYAVKAPETFLTKYNAKALFWLQHFVSAFLFWIG
ncbi:M1 family metallopeptidase [Arcticibacterium luteifluviistationis]|uniref:Peptidase M1 n=1 Tax=Arcticibacterium luteifluviistationis TaxID=1784714 RepID=A0A2Z4GD99_9BACT|nr:M1 family metallopeptidase [Arcticibacterium luteifluviistationis]AWV99124.1 peptidase M1 [Arcticibacterium luteifluviistationis]